MTHLPTGFAPGDTLATVANYPTLSRAHLPIKLSLVWRQVLELSPWE